RDFYTVLKSSSAKQSPAAGRAVAARQASTEELILNWPARLSVWNGERLQQADRTVIAKFGNVQRGLTRALAIAFGSGLLLMSAATVYILRLEGQMRARYVELGRSRRDLQELSSRLLDAQESERRSISRELHDEIGQSLGALLVDIGRLSALSTSVDP